MFFLSHLQTIIESKGREEEIDFDLVIQIGDVKVGARHYTIERLAEITIWLLQQKEVKKYLEEIKFREVKRSISGVG